MPSLDDDELQNMLDLFGEDVTVGVVTAKGIVERGGRAMLEGHGPAIIGKEISIIVKTDTFGDLKPGTELTLNGDAYVVRRRELEDDGAVSRIYVAQA